MKPTDEESANLTKLRTSKRTDANTGPIWFGFTSPSGKRYCAVHVLDHPKGPYILLSSENKDRTDFEDVARIVASNMNATLYKGISDRGNDICNVLRFRDVPKGFEKWLVERFDNFYSKQFSNVVVEVVY